jgi:ethanolamine ammonia-lyase small subunit
MSEGGAKPPRPADADGWAELRKLTNARIGLPRSGAALSTAPLLDFRLAHARARDAVHEALDETKLKSDLAALGLPILTVGSAADNRVRYLMRPDLGRRLGPDAQAVLTPHAGHHDVAFVLADGLSSRAVQCHAPTLLGALLPLLAKGWRVAPLVIVRHGRVAIGDAIAALLEADCVAMLIGERPGLSAPDSMGAYLTWRPHPGTTDADRNCISNIRPDGIAPAEAAGKLAHLLRTMRSTRKSGVSLKDESDRLMISDR